MELHGEPIPEAAFPVSDPREACGSYFGPGASSKLALVCLCFTSLPNTVEGAVFYSSIGEERETRTL